MKVLRLTRKYQHATTLIMSHHIIDIQPGTRDGSVIWMVEGRSVDVVETPDQIHEKLL